MPESSPIGPKTPLKQTQARSRRRRHEGRAVLWTTLLPCALLSSVLLAACPTPDGTVQRCNADEECPTSEVCSNGVCGAADPVPVSDAGVERDGGESADGNVVDGSVPPDAATDDDAGGVNNDGGTNDDGGVNGDAGDGFDGGVLLLDGGAFSDAGPLSGCTALSYDGRLYAACDVALSFFEARAACQAEGLDLAMPHDEQENAFLTMAISDFAGPARLGFSDIALEGVFVGVDGSDLVFSSWVAGEPNNGSTEPESCVELRQGSGWNDVSCADPLPFLCESADTVRASTLPYCLRDLDGCPCDMRVLNGGLYALCSSAEPAAALCAGLGMNVATPNATVSSWITAQEALSNFDFVCAAPAPNAPTDCSVVDETHSICGPSADYESARVSCLSHGLDLVIVDDAAEQAVVAAVAAAENDSVWLGLTDREREGVFRSIDGSLPAYANFEQRTRNRQPDNGTAEDCVEHNLGLSSWNDRSCSIDNTGVCEPVTHVPSDPGGVVCLTQPAACPCERVANDGKVYAICPGKMAHATARGACQGMGMALAMPKTLSELQWLRTQMIERVAYADTWLGITDTATEGTYLHGDGTPLNYDAWYPTEPTGDSQDCLRLGGVFDFQLGDLGCSSLLSYICEAPLPPSPGCTDADGDGFGVGCALGPDCADDDALRNPGRWDVCGGGDQDCSGNVDDDPVACTCAAVPSLPGVSHCEGGSWVTGMNECLSSGEPILAIDDDVEQSLVIGALGALGETAMWIGLNDVFSEGTWRWHTGVAPGFDGWVSGHPDSQAETNDCADLTVDGWRSRSCTNARRVLCGDLPPPQIDAGPPDAGPPDAGPPDAGSPDAGPPDAGPVDAG